MTEKSKKLILIVVVSGGTAVCHVFGELHLVVADRHGHGSGPVHQDRLARVEESLLLE